MNTSKALVTGSMDREVMVLICSISKGMRPAMKQRCILTLGMSGLILGQGRKKKKQGNRGSSYIYLMILKTVWTTTRVIQSG